MKLCLFIFSLLYAKVSWAKMDLGQLVISKDCKVNSGSDDDKGYKGPC
jgi:hypothetical protein